MLLSASISPAKLDVRRVGLPAQPPGQFWGFVLLHASLPFWKKSDMLIAISAFVVAVSLYFRKPSAPAHGTIDGQCADRISIFRNRQRKNAIFAECELQERMNAGLSRVAPLNLCAFLFLRRSSACEPLPRVGVLASRFISPRIKFEKDQE